MHRRFGGPLGYGFIPDPEGHLISSARRLLGNGPTPTSASVDDSAPPILDQRQTSSCTGQAFVAAEYTALTANGETTVLQSPAWAYKVGLCVDRVPRGDGTLADLVDEGAMPNQVVRGLEEWGTITAADYPLDETSILREPTIVELRIASRHRLIGWKRIRTEGAERVADVRRAIASKLPVAFAIDVDRTFEDYAGQGALGALKSASLGGHMLYATAYETRPDGSTVLHFRNSWGISWGLRGTAVGDERFIARMSALYTPGLRVAT